LAGDTAALQAHQKAADLMTAATDGQVIWQVEACSSAPCVEVSISGTVAAAGGPVAFDADGYTTAGRIQYLDLDHARRFGVILHEMGHVFGLNHGPGNIMMCGGVCGPGGACTVSPDQVGQFTPQERLAMKLMLQRRPGTVFPDNDRFVSAAFLTQAQGQTCAFPR